MISIEELKAELESLKDQHQNAERTVFLASGAIQALEHLIKKAEEKANVISNSEL